MRLDCDRGQWLVYIEAGNEVSEGSAVDAEDPVDP